MRSPQPPAAEPSWDEAEVIENSASGTGHYRLKLHSPLMARNAAAGQFVMVSLDAGPKPDEILLPRPMAIHRRYPSTGAFDIVYDVVGRGTAAMRDVRPGCHVLVTGPLGRGFQIPRNAASVLVVGRGVGICSVMSVVEDAIHTGRACNVVLSARNENPIGIDDLLELGASFTVVSDSTGSSEVRQLERRLIEQLDPSPPDFIAVCGAKRLIGLAARLGTRWGATVEASLEAHMACGLGYCHGCAAPVSADSSREGPLVCVDGPVFSVGHSQEAPSCPGQGQDFSEGFRQVPTPLSSV